MEVRTLYGLRLPEPELGGARSLHATQLGATGGVAHPIGAFSTAGARRLRAFLHYSSSHNRALRDCGLYVSIVPIIVGSIKFCSSISCILYVRCFFTFII